ncbi:transcription factor 25 [Patella vulgata]|uniref:transcription factor 25 n=1 Tax=Patella vulgata TaxID=6465 RepID=UPI00218008CC|nr:transcription factor 25 [Patella vulgata]
MSTKALRRLQNEDPLQEILKKVGGEQQGESNDDDETLGAPSVSKSKKNKKKKSAQINRFELLNKSDNIDDITNADLEELLREEEELLREEDDLKGVDPTTENTAIDKLEKEGIPENYQKKKKKKKRKKGKENKPEATETARGNENGEVEDEIDASLREVNQLLGDIGTAGDYTTSQITYTMKALLSVEHKNLNPDNEMRRIFGSRVIQAEQRRNRNRQRIHQRTTRLAQPKDTWAPYSKTGLSMSLLENRRGYQYFDFDHNSAYQEVQFLFLDAVESLNPQDIVNLLHLHPYHIGGLIQLSEIFRMSEDMAAAAELIEKALYAFECAFHPLFSLTSGNCRLDYRKPENRGFFLCLYKHLLNVGQKGCYRTALELSKLLLSLDADDDPLCVLLCIDFYALRCEQYDFLIRLYQEWEAHRNLSQLPNFGFSISLAKFHLANTDEDLEKADELLQKSLMMYPGVLMPMLEKCGITPDLSVTGHTFFQHSAQTSQTESLKQLITLYVQRTFSCWKEPEVISWLERNVKHVLEKVDSKQPCIEQYKQQRLRRYQGTPRNILRHIILSEIKDVTANLPPELANTPVLSYDPLPPVDSFETYQRPGRPTQAQEASNPLSLFLRSLLPNFNANEPVAPVDDGAVGGEGRNNLQQGVGALMTAMRDLLNNIRPVEPPVENRHNNGEGDEEELDEEWN